MAALALDIASAEPVFAQRQGGFLSGLFGNNQNNRNQQAANTAQRRANRAVQTALNFFEFDVGPVDGILGRKSRRAISEFQAFMGYEASGRLTHEERRFLLSSFNEISRNDDALALKVSLGLVSVQELLKAQSEGGATEAETTEDMANVGPPSMRTLCVNIGASGPLDLVTAQFCNLRQLAVEQSNFLMETSLNTTSIEPVISECQNFSAELRPHVSEIATSDSGMLTSEMNLWFRRSGASSEKLARLAETCLGVAYLHDDAESALASLLALSGLKDPIYIELLGYHLALGLGFDGRSDFSRARGWMEIAVASLSEGDVSLTAQSNVQRSDILVDIITLFAAQE